MPRSSKVGPAKAGNATQPCLFQMCGMRQARGWDAASAGLGCTKASLSLERGLHRARLRNGGLEQGCFYFPLAAPCTAQITAGGLTAESGRVK